MSLHWLQKPMHAMAYTEASKVLAKSKASCRIFRWAIRMGRCGDRDEEEDAAEAAPFIACARHFLPSQGAPLMECQSSKPVIQLVSVPWPTFPALCEEMKRQSNASQAGILASSHTLKSSQKHMKQRR